MVLGDRGAVPKLDAKDMKIQFSEDEFNSLVKARKVFGHEAMIDSLVEECAELIQAIMHLRRGRCDAEKVSEEMADVFLMINQLSTQPEFDSSFGNHLSYKTSRFMDRIKRENGSDTRR